jgi:hypothetical protein
LQCIADATNGTYIEATNAAGLANAIRSVVSNKCGDATLIGVRGSGDNKVNTNGDDPGRHANAIAKKLQELGVELYEPPAGGINPNDADSKPNDGVVGLFYPASTVKPTEGVGETLSYKQSHDAGVRSLIGKIDVLRSTAVGCGPNHPILLTGFSQGAHVIQSTLDKLSSDSKGDSISGVVLIASPRFSPMDPSARGTFLRDYPRNGIARPAKVPARFSPITRTYCVENDPVCVNSGLNLFGTVATLNKSHENAYSPSLDTNPMLRDAAGLFEWRLGKGSGRAIDPQGSVTAYRGWDTQVTRVSAAEIYSRGAPSVGFKWDFNNDGKVDKETSEPWVSNNYGFRPGNVTTKVEVKFGDSTSRSYTVCIKKFGGATCRS